MSAERQIGPYKVYDRHGMWYAERRGEVAKFSSKWDAINYAKAAIHRTTKQSAARKGEPNRTAR